MNVRHSIAYATVAIIILSTLIGVATYPQDNERTHQHERITRAVESDPIDVNSNEELEALDLPGSGTESDPFRIEFLNFSLNNESTSSRAIRLFETDAHIVIRNCTFRGWLEYELSGYPIVKGGGITIWNVSNCIIANNTFSQLATGVYMMGERNIKVISNIFEGTCYWDYEHGGLAISVQWNQLNSSHVLVENNTIRNYAIGIHIARARNSVFRHNIMFNCSDGILISETIQNITILKNTCNNSTRSGIVIGKSKDVMILNNTCNMNRIFGIWVDEYSTNITISFNEALWNGNTSIWIQPPLEPNSAVLSELRDACGIWVHDQSSGNTITWNDIAYNKNNVLNDGASNFYDYNYWSDYEGVDENDDKIGDVPYETGGYVIEEDVHPRLTTLSEWNAITTELPTSTTTTISPTSTQDTDQQPMLMVIGFGSIMGLVVFVVLYRKYKDL